MINAVIDVSHHNSPVKFHAIRASGILGVIHKATKGNKFKDRAYPINRELAKDVGIMWGAYHFGVGGVSGATQAHFFLETVGANRETLLALDFETNPHGPTMTLDQARDFVRTIYAETGKYPGFYSGHWIKETLGNHTDDVLVNCWFWLVQYGPEAIVPPCWDKWTLWQYTDGMAGNAPHTVDGVGFCDRNMFNGDEKGLRRLWGIE